MYYTLETLLNHVFEEGLYEDTDDSDSYDAKVGAKTPKIGPGNQVMQFWENGLSNRVNLII